MKKIYLFLLLAVIGITQVFAIQIKNIGLNLNTQLVQSDAPTVGIVVGERLLSTTPYSFKDGDKIIIEAVSTTKNYGYYIKDDNGYKWAQGLDGNSIWKLVSSGTANRFYLQNIGTGKYAGPWDNNMVENIADAREVQFFNISTNSNIGKSDYNSQKTYPRGWDEDSWAIQMFNANGYDQWWRNDGGSNETGAVHTGGTNKHNTQWNIYRVRNEYWAYLKAFEKENSGWLSVYEELKTKFDECMAEAEADNPLQSQYDAAKTGLENILAIAKEEYPAVKPEKGERLKISEVQDGDKVIIEAASSSENWGYYIKEEDNKYQWLQGFDFNCVWKIIATGNTITKNSHIANTYKFQNIASGKYIGNCEGYIMTADANEAEIYGIYNVANPPYENKKYDKKPIGWDNESWILYDTNDKFLRNNTYNKDGAFDVKTSATYTWQWNVYKLRNQYWAYLKSFEKENAGWLSDVALKKKFDELMAEAEAENPLQCQFDAAKVTLAKYLNEARYENEKGKRLNSTTYSFKEGDRIIIEAVSTTKNYGYYIKDDNGYKWAQGFDENCVWELVASGTANRFYLQNIGTGKYVGPWNNNMVENIADAREVQFFNISTNSNIGKSDYTDQEINPRGWDEDSWAIQMFNANGSNQWLRNDVKDITTGTINAGNYKKCSTQWNIYRTKRNVPTETIKADVLDVEFGNENNATDVSGNNYTITPNGAVSNFYDSNIGKYVADIDYAKSGDYYKVIFSNTIGDPIHDAMPNGYSFETVLSIKDFNPSTAEIKWFGSTNSGGNAMMLRYGKFAMTNYVGGSYKWANNNNSAAGVMTPETNTFYHVVGIWDKEKGESRIYVDGILLGKGTNSTGDFNFGLTYFGIGANGNGGGGSWKIATQRIYSQALDDEQVMDLYLSISDDMEKTNAFNALDEFVTNEPDYSLEPNVIQSSLVAYNQALNVAKDVIAEVKALTSGKTTRTAQEYLELIDAIIQAKQLIARKMVLDGEIDAEKYNNLDLTNYAVIDFSAATLDPNVTYDLLTSKISNANTLFYLPENTSITGNNVIVNGVCDNLVLTDGQTFAPTKSFTATNATYTRTMPTESTWGTICLPYEVSSDDNTVYYTEGSVNGVTLTLIPTDIVPAGTPAIFQTNGASLEATGSGTINIEASNAPSDITLHGTFVETKITDENAYYIKANKFWRRAEGTDSYFVLKPFRAYFTVDAANSPTFNINVSDNPTGIVELLENPEIVIEGYYSENGILSKTPKKGINIIKYRNKKSQIINIK